MKKQTKEIMNLCKVHFAYAAIFIVSLLVFDAWKLLAPGAVTHRWVLISIIMAVTLAVWLAAKAKNFSPLRATWIFIILDLAVATYSVYAQRGIGSKAVFLFVIPILVAADMLGRWGVTFVTALAVILYYAACLIYFDQHPGQAYTVEVWAETGFYAALLVLVGYISRQLKVR